MKQKVECNTSNLVQDMVRGCLENLVHKRRTLNELNAGLNKFFGVKNHFEFVEFTTDVDCDFRIMFDVLPENMPKFGDMCGHYEIWYLDTREMNGNVKYITEVSYEFEEYL